MQKNVTTVTKRRNWLNMQYFCEVYIGAIEVIDLGISMFILIHLLGGLYPSRLMELAYRL